MYAWCLGVKDREMLQWLSISKSGSSLWHTEPLLQGIFFLFFSTFSLFTSVSSFLNHLFFFCLKQSHSQMEGRCHSFRMPLINYIQLVISFVIYLFLFWPLVCFFFTSTLPSAPVLSIFSLFSSQPQMGCHLRCWPTQLVPV